MKALTNSRLSKAVLAATGACLLLAVTSTILASQRIRPWQIKNYAITDQRDEVFPWASITQPPEKWKPDLSEGLDIALPFPWPEAYINQYKQPFNPWTFVKNALALCNYLRET